MTLNEAQIEHIKAYINSRGFTNIEVETEILDHVASSVEDEMEKNPNLSLDEAIYNVHWSFGIFGFERIESGVSQSIRGYLWQSFKTHLWQQWSTHHVLRNLATVALIIILLKAIPHVISGPGDLWIELVMLGLISCFPALRYIKTFKNWKAKSALTGKLLVPYSAAGFWAVYLLQFFSFSRPDAFFADIILVIASLWVSTCLWAGISMISEAIHWSNERWLKYQP